MTTINGRACVVNGVPVDKVFSDGKQVYGRNLVTGTSKELKTTVPSSGWGNSPTRRPSETYGAGKYYASTYIENTTPVEISIYVRIDGRGYNIKGDSIPSGQSGVVSFTFDILDGDSLYGIWVGFSKSQTESYTYKYKEMMITRTPSPWTPAPEDYI